MKRYGVEWLNRASIKNITLKDNSHRLGAWNQSRPLRRAQQWASSGWLGWLQTTCWSCWWPTCFGSRHFLLRLLPNLALFHSLKSPKWTSSPCHPVFLDSSGGVRCSSCFHLEDFLESKGSSFGDSKSDRETGNSQEEKWLFSDPTSSWWAGWHREVSGPWTKLRPLFSSEEFLQKPEENLLKLVLLSASLDWVDLLWSNEVLPKYILIILKIIAIKIFIHFEIFSP